MTNAEQSNVIHLNPPDNICWKGYCKLMSYISDIRHQNSANTFLPNDSHTKPLHIIDANRL